MRRARGERPRLDIGAAALALVIGIGASTGCSGTALLGGGDGATGQPVSDGGVVGTGSDASASATDGATAALPDPDRARLVIALFSAED